MTTYRKAAAAAYSLLVDQYKTPGIFDNDFWFGGNTLHTCLTYLITADMKDNDALLKTAHEVYNNAVKPIDGLQERGWWRDDYGWWGNAFMLAYNNRTKLGYENPIHHAFFDELLAAAKHCWGKLDGNWRDIAYAKISDNADGSYPITGGTFNTFDTPPMSGRNSVTNEQFWLLSQRLAHVDPMYKKRAEDESRWFGQWLKLPPAVGLLNKQGLVLERPTGNGTDPKWYWSGDQGLCINALLYYLINNASAVLIAKAVTTNMTDQDGILHENMDFTAHGLREFIVDYATGKGIFIRALSSLNANLVDHTFSEFIMKNAAAVWACRLVPANQFTFNWNPSLPGGEPKILEGKRQDLCNLVMQTAGLEALTASLLIGGDEALL